MATSAWLHAPSNMRLTECLESVLKEQRPQYLPALLANYREHGVLPTQVSSGVGGLVGFTSAKLSTSKTKYEGLCLLSVLVKDSSTEVFQQHCLTWLRLLQQVIQSQAPLQTVQLAVSILHDLLQYSAMLPELAREVGLNCVLGILTSLLGLKTECELAAMEGMTACMTYYPRACGSLRDKLGAYFLAKMDSSNQKTQAVACQCYGRLPCLGGVLERGAGGSRAEAWANQIHCLLASANSTLAQLYQGAESEGTVKYDGPGLELPFPPLDDSDTLYLLQLQHRYRAVCLALKHTLNADPTSVVRLPVRQVLNLICRALSVSPKSINMTDDGSLRLLVLPAVHGDTLKVLAALIVVMRGGMVKFAAVLQRLFCQTLSAWTPASETSLGQQKAFSSVRVTVYTTLELWVQVAGASSNVLQGSATHSELLFSHLLGDITPGAESVKLRAGQASTTHVVSKPGPRCSKPLAALSEGSASLQRKGNQLANQDTCLSALKALRWIIMTSGSLLKDDIHKRLHDVVLPLCVRLQQQQSSNCNGSSEPQGGVSGQYAGSSPRRQLYRLLLALVVVPSPRWPPPLNCAVSILSQGRRDRSLQVSSFCCEALTICNCLLHPRSPSVSLPLPPLALKPTPTAPPVLPQSQCPPSGLTLPTLLGGPPSGPPFSSRHTLGLGSAALLGSLENHLSMVSALPSQAPVPGDMLLSPHAHLQPDHLSELGPQEGQRPVFVRYDKEEAEDVEISLASDSDDSVVIVPPEMLGVDTLQEDTVAPATSGASATSGAAGVALAGGESGGATTAATTTTIDDASLPDLPSSVSLLTTSNSTAINSFPPSAASLVPPMTSSGLTIPTSGLGDSLPGGPQLQQMLMQSPAPGQSGAPGLPLSGHQLQNQLAQQARHLHHHHPPQPASNEDSAVININSSDEEEEDEDMDDEDELGDEEEEGMEDDEDEEGSDFPDEEFYDGEDYDEDEELEDEEERDEDMPPLEVAGEERRADPDEGKTVRRPEAEERPVGEGEMEGGIEEVKSNRAAFEAEQGAGLQEVESIGVMEEAREAEGVEEEEDDSERMDDPTMPQILCVTGGGMEEREEGEAGEGEELGRALAEEDEVWQQGAVGVKPSSVDDNTEDVQQQEPGPLPAEEPSVGDHQPSSPQEEPAAAEQDAVAAEAEASSTERDGDVGAPGDGETAATVDDDAKDGDAAGNEKLEDGKGVKRKREEEHMEAAGQSTEKKRVDDVAMASMLADFIACPPDDEDCTTTVAQATSK